MINRPLETEIKSTVINHLVGSGHVCSGDIIINEFMVGDFSRRVDLALFKADRMFAFEVKSEADTLTRLEGQVEKYLTYFDKVIVVTAPKHTNKVLLGMPSDVAVWEVSNGNIHIKRKGRIRNIRTKNEFLKMMTALELKKFASRLNIKTSNKRRKTLETALIALPAFKLRAEAIKCIRLRYRERSECFFGNISKGVSTPEDIDHLKSYKRDIVSDNSPDIDSYIFALDEFKSL